MPMNIGKPNINKDLRTGFRLMHVTHSAPQRAARKGQIATNHTITSVRGGGKAPSANPLKRKVKY